MFKLAQDKKKHVAAGFLMSLLVIVVPVPYVALLVTLVAAGKEVIWDLLMNKGCPEWADFWWTLAGGVPILALFCFL